MIPLDWSHEVHWAKSASLMVPPCEEIPTLFQYLRLAVDSLRPRPLMIFVNSAMTVGLGVLRSHSIALATPVTKVRAASGWLLMKSLLSTYWPPLKAPN